MTKEHLKDYLDYHYWATEHLLKACSLLSQEQLLSDRGGSFGSLFATLVHMYSAEAIWLNRWQGKEPLSFSAPSDFIDLADLQETWLQKEKELRAFFETTPSDTVIEVIAFSHSLWQMLMHMIDHSSFHRGQVIHILRQTGLEPPKSNFIHYLRAKPETSS